MGAAPNLNLTVEQYLDYDDTADCRTEFHDGEIFRMDDVSYHHALLETRVATAFAKRLGTVGPCQALGGGVRVRLAGDEFVRPDVAVVCGQPTYTNDRRAITNLSLVVEILSPSTADYDYGGKFELYRQMDSLQEYALVSQTRPRIEVFRKIATGEWLLSSYNGLEAVIPFPSLSLEIPMIELYAGIEF
jgi:Uma2 family endonuclease